MMNEFKNDVVKLFDKISGKMTEVILEGSRSRKVRYLNELYVEKKTNTSLTINSSVQDEVNKGESMQFKINLDDIRSLTYGLGCFWMDLYGGKKMIISIYDTKISDMKVLLNN
jgi:hypothetical protein